MGVLGLGTLYPQNQREEEKESSSPKRRIVCEREDSLFLNGSAQLKKKLKGHKRKKKAGSKTWK